MLAGVSAWPLLFRPRRRRDGCAFSFERCHSGGSIAVGLRGGDAAPDHTSTTQPPRRGEEYFGPGRTRHRVMTTLSLYPVERWARAWRDLLRTKSRLFPEA